MPIPSTPATSLTPDECYAKAAERLTAAACLPSADAVAQAQVADRWIALANVAAVTENGLRTFAQGFCQLITELRRQIDAMQARLHEATDRHNKLVDAMDAIAAMASEEAAAGTPARVVAQKVRAAAAHARARHTGPAQECAPCTRTATPGPQMANAPAAAADGSAVQPETPLNGFPASAASLARQLTQERNRADALSDDLARLKEFIAQRHPEAMPAPDAPIVPAVIDLLTALAARDAVVVAAARDLIGRVSDTADQFRADSVLETRARDLLRPLRHAADRLRDLIEGGPAMTEAVQDLLRDARRVRAAQDAATVVHEVPPGEHLVTVTETEHLAVKPAPNGALGDAAQQ